MNNNPANAEFFWPGPVRFLAGGDTALIVEFGDRIDQTLSDAVLLLDDVLAQNTPQGVVETVPSFRSLMINYDPRATDFETLTAGVEDILSKPAQRKTTQRRWQLPLCFDDEFAPDLADVSERTGIEQNRVIETLLSAEQKVFMLGFAPGQPYIGEIPNALALPRRIEPRLRVPAGSVAIAMTMSVIYSQESPGGWHLVGRTPIRIFNLAWPEPALLSAGDRINFSRISRNEYHQIERAVQNDDYRPVSEAVTE